MEAVALVGRLLLALVVVLGIMWFIGRRVKRGPGRVRNSKMIDVLGRQQLSRTASVAIVRVMDKALIVGVTDGQVTVLSEADLDAVEQSLDEQAQPRKVRLTKDAAAAVPARPRPNPRPNPRPAPRTAATLSGLRNQRGPARERSYSAPRRATLQGSALSLNTWRQTVDSLKELTVRTR